MGGAGGLKRERERETGRRRKDECLEYENRGIGIRK